MLWRFYIAANRPSTRKVAATISAWPEDRRTGSANHETIRRTLRAESVGAWQTVEMIFLALCDLADVDPEDTEGDEGDRWDPPVRHIDRIRRCWHEAMDESPVPELPRTRTERAAQEAAERAAAEARAHAIRLAGDDPPF
jgi:hypothetical protein